MLNEELPQAPVIPPGLPEDQSRMGRVIEFVAHFTLDPLLDKFYDLDMRHQRRINRAQR